MSEQDVNHPTASAQLDIEIKQAQLAREKQMTLKAELENQHLAHQIKKLEDDKDRSQAESKSRGATLRANNAAERVGFNKCTHKKGGSMDNYPQGDGEHGGYAVRKHRMPSNEIHVACLRCGKEWVPIPKPVASDSEFKTSKGAFDDQKFKLACDIYKLKMEDYWTAVKFPTDNKTSSGPIFNYKDQEVARRAFPGTNPADGA